LLQLWLQGLNSPSCPYPKQEQGYVALCGNYGKEGHLPPECPEPYKPKMLVRYAQEPTPPPNRNQQKTELVRLVYTDANNSETCGTVTLVERDIYKSGRGGFQYQTCT
jgi:hypothetical protein